MERVEIIEGDTPVLLIAPHGVDDKNTDRIAESVASQFGAFAVINKGWKRNATVDYWRDLANCNNIAHLHEDVVKEEFLNPILRYVAKIKKKYQDGVFILILHGCGDEVREKAKDQDLDLIVGFGDGRPPSYTCRIKTKNAFIHYLKKENFGVYEGKAKGKFAGRNKNNLNQLFTEWYPDGDVNCLQLEIVNELRSDKDLIQITSDGIISAIDSLLLFDDTIDFPEERFKQI